MGEVFLAISLCALAFALVRLSRERRARPRMTQRFLIHGPEADAARAMLANIRKGLHPYAGLTPHEVAIGKPGLPPSGASPK